MTSKVCKFSFQAEDVAENLNSNDDMIEVVDEISREDYNHIIKIHRSCQKCNIKFQLSKKMSKEHPNPFKINCKTSYVESVQNNNLSEDNKQLRNKQKPEKSINPLNGTNNNKSMVNMNKNNIEHSRILIKCCMKMIDQYITTWSCILNLLLLLFAEYKYLFYLLVIRCCRHIVEN